MIPLLALMPWLALLAFLLFVARVPRELPPAEALDPDAAPKVTVIVPARNESVNIDACLRSITGSSYPSFDVVVVDDRSEDDTAALARSVPLGKATALNVVDGRALPDGWLGKPWACWQGAREAAGELLLFTDADTVHGPHLLERAVAGLEEDRADLMTVLGRQVMGSFWERLVQPQIFLTMLLRFPDFERIAANDRWRDAIANGQFILFPREAYDQIGGHAAVRDEVVEDLALAQVVKRAGLHLRVRTAEEDLATRMYRSLGGIVEGWSKNIVMGGLQSVPPWARAFVPPVAFAAGIGLWLAPPSIVLAGLLGWVGRGALVWGLAVTATSALLWSVFTRRMGAAAAYGLLYPLGAAVASYIFLRSWLRGRDVEWKGRRYRLKAVSERP